jgi:hypothetical protein
MTGRDIRFIGTTYLLIAIQIVGLLAIIGGVIVFFDREYGPLAGHLGFYGIFVGLVTMAAASVGRVIVEVAEAYMNSLMHTPSSSTAPTSTESPQNWSPPNLSPDLDGIFKAR